MYSDDSIEQMAIAATQFNIFGSVTQKEISVGYISSIRGYVPNISLCEANDHEKEYPNIDDLGRTSSKRFGNFGH